MHQRKLYMMEKNIRDSLLQSEFMVDIKEHIFEIKRCFSRASKKHLYFLVHKKSFAIDKKQPIEEKIMCVLKGTFLAFNKIKIKDKELDIVVRQIFKSLANEEFLYLATAVKTIKKESDKEHKK